MNKKKRKIRKSFIVLNIGILAVMIFSIVYVLAVGGSYSLRSRVFPGENGIASTRMIVRDEGVVQVTGIRLDNGEIVVDFTAVGQGSTSAKLTYEIGGEQISHDEYVLEVNAFNMIIDRTGGAFSFNGFRAVIYALVAQLAMIEVIVLWMFIDYSRKGDFCYPMIACGGIAIYIVILLLYVTYYLINNYMLSFTFFLTLVNNAGMMMLLAITPIMLLLSVMLAVSNIWLMRHEGYRPVNALGILFAVLWAIGMAATVGVYILPIPWDAHVYYRFILPLVYVIGYLECMFISTVVSSFMSVKYKVPYGVDYIIILGCAIRGDGTLTPLLKGRVDSAVEFEKRQYEQTGKHAVFVPSGGQGSDEVISEGEAMENYLLSIGVPADRIAREDKSTNTYENMKFSKEVIDRHSGGADADIAFATTNYHVFRGYILSKKLGFSAKGISAGTKYYFFPNAFLREFIGLLVDQKRKHLIYMAVIVAFFTLLDLVI